MNDDSGTTPPIYSHALCPQAGMPSVNKNFKWADLSSFPEEHQEHHRFTQGEFGGWSDHFMDAMEKARDRIWLVDPFLLKVDNDERTFWGVFEKALNRTAAKDTRLLTKSKGGHENQFKKLKELERRRQGPPLHQSFTIDVRVIRDNAKSQTRLPHDRFAIVDDELWHWGANIGGTHHEVNAYSRGWSASKTEADIYFERIWKRAERVRP